jgi:hypothetical protein
VFYETGRHTEGLAWLDGWIRDHGPEANNRSHFSWHAALHELMQCDVDAVRRRYLRELAPPLVSGSRVLVDSGALLWRCQMTGIWQDDQPIAGMLDSVPEDWLDEPTTPFAAMHAAVGLAVAGDTARLASLRAVSTAHADPVFRDVVAPLCRGLSAVVAGEWTTAADTLASVVGRSVALGGSAAQREVIEDTLVHALAHAGRGERAAEILDVRLSRRASPLDARRRAAARVTARG